MVYVRRELVINEVSLCRDPANPKARVALFKSRDPEPGSVTQTDDARASADKGQWEHLARGLIALANFLTGEEGAFQMAVGRGITEEEPQPRRRRGRPRKYDWDEFDREVIRIANTADGLPESQADLVRTMSDWWQTKLGDEPANSSLREKISLIYRHINDADNS